jgi:nicotinamide riboside kinase
VTLRVVIFGPECTGKSTLAQVLAEHFGGVVSIEFVRSWVDENRRLPTTDDLPDIVAGQIASEMDAVRLAGPRGIVFHDTDLHTHGIYADHYLGQRTAEAEHAARTADYTHHLICDIDLPWTPDGIQRDSPEARAALFPKFISELHRFRRPYTLISGHGDHRTARAMEVVRRLLKKR